MVEIVRTEDFYKLRICFNCLYYADEQCERLNNYDLTVEPCDCCKHFKAGNGFKPFSEKQMDKLFKNRKGFKEPMYNIYTGKAKSRVNNE